MTSRKTGRHPHSIKLNVSRRRARCARARRSRPRSADAASSRGHTGRRCRPGRTSRSPGRNIRGHNNTGSMRWRRPRWLRRSIRLRLPDPTTRSLRVQVTPSRRPAWRRQPVPSVSSSWQSLSQTPESLVPTKVPIHLERPPHLATDHGHIVSYCSMTLWRKRNPQAPA